VGEDRLDLLADELAERLPAVGAEEAGLPQRIEEGRPEGVAGADRVRHLDGVGVDLDHVVRADPERPLAAPGDHDRLGAQGQQATRGLDLVQLRVDRLEVLVGGLDQVGDPGHPLHPVDEVGPGARDRRPGVDVVADRRHLAQPLEQRDHVVGARAQHRAERAGVHHQGIRVGLHRVEPPLEVELVVRGPVHPDRGLRRRGPGDGSRVGGQGDAGRAQVLRDQVAVVVVGEAGREPDGPAEPGQGDGHVGRAAAGVLLGLAVRRVDDVDQGLTHHQHVALHGETLTHRRGGAKCT